MVSNSKLLKKLRKLLNRLRSLLIQKRLRERKRKKLPREIRNLMIRNKNSLLVLGLRKLMIGIIRLNRKRSK